MDLSLERDSSALGSLFQQIINDMKVSFSRVILQFLRKCSVILNTNPETECSVFVFGFLEL